MRNILFFAIALILILNAALPVRADKITATISPQALDYSTNVSPLNNLKNIKPVLAQKAMVVTAQHIATQVGLRILKQGGNAIDAAVAIGYALAVVHPCCGNIGGGGFMILHLSNGQNQFLDFREKAPLKAHADLFLNRQGEVIPHLSTQTYLSVGVPGTVMGLNAALMKYGTLSLNQVMNPAIELARNGYILGAGDVHILDERVQDFRKYPNVAAIFLNHGRPWKPGQRLRQPQLATTLERIASGGSYAFYHGPIARAIVAASEAHHGLLSMKDFSDYHVVWGKPIECTYHGYTIVSDPPPSSGGVTICEILQIIKPYPLSKWGFASVKTLHYLIEAERHAFADRNTYLGDPAFVHNPIKKLLSSAHAAKIRAEIQPDVATPSVKVKGSLGPTEGTDTTQFSVVDAKGNAVSVTYTINYLFGLGQIAGNTGFFLNNEMDDFTSKPGVPNSFGLIQGRANRIEPGKRPLSSMSPSIVLHKGQLFMVTGSPGGSTIISTTLETMLNVIDFGMNMQQAVDAPRFHEQWFPSTVLIEPGLLTRTVRKRLEQMGYRFTHGNAWGAAMSILVNPKNGFYEGAADHRRPESMAAGY